MSVAQRSALMGRIRGKDTGPERFIAAALAETSLDWECHARDLPGRPDFVFRHQRIALFVDGDFWHGWRFPKWQHKLAPFWAEKIAMNRARDRRNHARLRRAGWQVIRLWEHEIEREPDDVMERLLAVLLPRDRARRRRKSIT